VANCRRSTTTLKMPLWACRRPCRSASIVRECVRVRACLLRGCASRKSSNQDPLRERGLLLQKNGPGVEITRPARPCAHAHARKCAHAARRVKETTNETEEHTNETEERTNTHVCRPPRSCARARRWISAWGPRAWAREHAWAPRAWALRSEVCVCARVRPVCVCVCVCLLLRCTHGQAARGCSTCMHKLQC
jgi:hypothetical protein